MRVATEGRPFDPALGAGGRPLTAEQREAVEDRRGSLLLSATAGSGKTSVMVERFVRLALSDEAPVTQLLAITFTDKEYLLWKAPIPGVGHSSPVVWGDALFLQSGSKVGKPPV